MKTLKLNLTPPSIANPLNHKGFRVRPNLFRHLTDYARSQLTFSRVKKPLRGRNLVFARDCFVAALLAMTMFCVLPSFAADDEMTVSVPEYISIEKQTTKGFSRELTIIDSSTIQMTSSFHIQYGYHSNSNTNIYISFTAPVTNGNKINAWNAPNYSGEQCSCVFTKNDNSATETSVLNALSNNPVPENNPNVIGFATHVNWASGVLRGVSNDAATFTTETLQPSGSFWIAPGYNNARRSLSGTFSPHDSAGVYTATVHITTISP